ncbi:MAG: hypothetical protein WC919_04075 [Candidatus Paceibacterota bacterium]|jgi:hypothetical protein
MAKHKKKKYEPELVTTCDKCHEPLGRSCMRTINSAICASGDGIKVRIESDSRVFFFCCLRCRDKFGEE